MINSQVYTIYSCNWHHHVWSSVTFEDNSDMSTLSIYKIIAYKIFTNMCIVILIVSICLTSFKAETGNRE